MPEEELRPHPGAEVSHLPRYCWRHGDGHVTLDEKSDHPQSSQSIADVSDHWTHEAKDRQGLRPTRNCKLTENIMRFSSFSLFLPPPPPRPLCLSVSGNIIAHSQTYVWETTTSASMSKARLAFVAPCPWFLGGPVFSLFDEAAQVCTAQFARSQQKFGA